MTAILFVRIYVRNNGIVYDDSARCLLMANVAEVVLGHDDTALVVTHIFASLFVISVKAGSVGNGAGGWRQA